MEHVIHLSLYTAVSTIDSFRKVVFAWMQSREKKVEKMEINKKDEIKNKHENYIEKIEAFLTGIVSKGRTSLLEHEVYKVLQMMGLKCPDSFFIDNEKDITEANISKIPGKRVICKIISPDLPHRFEIGGVVESEKSIEALKAVFESLKELANSKNARFEGMLIVQKIDCNESIPHQLLLSLRQDASMGPVVFLGTGGVGTELYKEAMKDGKALISVHHLLAERKILERKLKDTFFFPVLSGRTRISKERLLDDGTLPELIEKFSLLAYHLSPLNNSSRVNIEELEINPLQVMGKNSLVPLDGLMKISTSKHQFTPPKPELIEKLLYPSSILVIGASATKLNVGRIILRNIIKGGGIDRDKIYVMHPEAEDIDGCKTIKSIEKLPEAVDMAVFTIPADENSIGIIESLIKERKARSITLISAGFAETDKGKELEEKLKKTIRKERARDDGGVAVNGPNCMGIVSRPGKYNTFFLPEYKLPVRSKYGKNCALISQSGAYIVTLMSNLSRTLNPRYMITFGNQIDISITDYLITLKDDREIEVFCLYFEGFKPYDGHRFIKVASEIVRSGRTIILYKAGRTEEGAKAIASHTASMAGDYEILKETLTDAGVIVVDTLDEFEDLIKVFSLLSNKKCRGNRVGIYSNAGFECSVAADSLGTLVLADFSRETIEKLHTCLPTNIIDIHNPIDATPQTNTVNYGKCLFCMLDDPGVDCILAANVAPTPFMENLPASSEHNENIENENSYPNVTIRVFQNTDKPMVVSLNSGELYDPAVHMMEDAGIPVYRKIDRAIKALDIFINNKLNSE